MQLQDYPTFTGSILPQVALRFWARGLITTPSGACPWRVLWEMLWFFVRRQIPAEVALEFSPSAMPYKHFSQVQSRMAINPTKKVIDPYMIWKSLLTPNGGGQYCSMQLRNNSDTMLGSLPKAPQPNAPRTKTRYPRWAATLRIPSMRLVIKLLYCSCVIFWSPFWSIGAAHVNTATVTGDGSNFWFASLMICTFGDRMIASEL